MAVDERFDPRKALAATGRYLKIAMDEFGREDLAVVSYHMGIGNLQTLLGAYGDDEASYAQLFFDTAPDSHPRAHRILTGLGDDSKTYLWRVLASAQIMRLLREDRARLERLDRLHTAAPSGELVLHPPTGRRSSRPEDGRTRFPDDLGAYGLRARGGRSWSCAPGAFGIASYIGQGAREISGARRPLVLSRANGWLRFRDPPRLRERPPGRGLPVHARPPPGAEPDRLGPRPGRHPGHRVTRGRGAAQ